ncbi:polyketide cyclase [Chitinophaga agrisoli]|uniref:Polyketide cyclase n=1 Tax=Chitinophaga agrisoli TaxID=2607653 RepID=A0A5B2VL68_9BACT|nr:SRPBCC family protein [Chitinophaga agrisoli]KAA2239564.1 polyketide cyclase [Chitinophaga agrisoli]
MENQSPITIQATINAPVEKVWQYWSLPEHITKWNQASDDWHTPTATNDLRTGGTFSSRMEAKDGSWGFDFGGTYTNVQDHQLIAYTMGDGRTVNVTFTGNGDTTEVVETFDPEATHSREMQQSGWQAILDNFRKYVEQH